MQCLIEIFKSSSGVSVQGPIIALTAQLFLLQVTQHKDNETWSHSAWYDSNIPQDPVTSLDFYMNSEPRCNACLLLC